MLVGEHSEIFGDVTKQPAIDIYAADRWIVPVDAIHVNGRSLDFNRSLLPSLQNTQQLGGLLDSGTTTLVLPDKIVDDIFSADPDAFYDEVDSLWILPCMRPSVNVSITLG